MIGLLLIFSFTLYENFFYKNLNKSPIKLYNYAIIFLVTAMVYGTIALVQVTLIDMEDSLLFLGDWRFWLFVLVEVFGMYTLNMNYINNPDNHTSINVGIFSTVLLTPLVVYVLDGFFGFEDTLKVTLFNNITNILMFIGVYSVIGLLYFMPKIKEKEVHKPYLIAITSILLLLSFYIEVKLLQTYKFNFLLYAVMDIFFFLLYLQQSMVKEKGYVKEIKKKHFVVGVKYAFFGVIHLVGMTLLAVEVAVLGRRVSQILVGIIVDKKRQHLFDIVLVLIMILGGFLLLYL